MRVRVGDNIEVHLKNHEDSRMMHNVDFHAATGPGGGGVATVADPGKEKGFTFKALNPGLYVYHCAVAPVAMHVSNGMYGLILVEPEGGLPPVDNEFYVMQGEIYTRGIRQEGLLTESYDKLIERDSRSISCSTAPSARSPAQCAESQGRRDGADLLRRWRAEFHVVLPCHRRDFRPCLSAGLGGEPAVEACRASPCRPVRPIVEFKLEVPGPFVLVDHALSRAERGLAGYLIVEGEPQTPEIFNAPPNDNASGH